MEQRVENKMGTASISKLIWSMSLPMMFSMLVQAMYNIVDSFFVAKVSENALTAVSYVMPAQTLLIGVAVGTGVGVNSLIARRLGAGNQTAANSAATHGVFFGIFSWLIFVLVGIFLTNPFANAMTTDTEIVSLINDYMSVIMICSLGMFVAIMLEKILQSTGDMLFPMISQLIGALVNIALDPVFIFGLLGVPALGVLGAAVATVIGQFCAMFFLITVMLVKKHKVHIAFKGFRFQGNVVRDIYAVGFPSMLMQSVGSILLTGMNLILGGFTDTAVAVYGIYFKLQSFVFMPVYGLTQGTLPIMGYNFGAHNRERLLACVKQATIIALCIMTAGTAIFWIFPAQLLAIFGASETMLEIGIPALRIIAGCFILAAIGIMFTTFFQAVGRGKLSLWVSLLRQLAVLLPVAYLMSKFGLVYVWTAFPIAELVAAIVTIIWFKQTKRDMIDVL